MTVLMTSELAGVDREGYDQLAGALKAAMQASDGFIAHASGPIDGGYGVFEIWESEAAHQAWFTGHVAPALPPGAPTPPISYQPISSVFIAVES